MLPIARTLKTLEEKTHFSRSFLRATERSENWPAQWMTAEQINEELTQRGFWARERRVVHPDARVRVVTYYLDQQVLKASHAGGVGGWKCFDGQYKLNPQSKLLNEPSRAKSEPRGHRSSMRKTVSEVRCQYGPVLDMSETGLRFCSEREADFLTGQKGFIRLSCGPLTVRVKVRILWMTDGVEGLTVGCDFRRVEDEQRTLLDQILARGSELAGGSEAA